LTQTWKKGDSGSYQGEGTGAKGKLDLGGKGRGNPKCWDLKKGGGVIVSDQERGKRNQKVLLWRHLK